VSASPKVEAPKIETDPLLSVSFAARAAAVADAATEIDRAKVRRIRDLRAQIGAEEERAKTAIAAASAKATARMVELESVLVLDVHATVDPVLAQCLDSPTRELAATLRDVWLAAKARAVAELGEALPLHYLSAAVYDRHAQQFPNLRVIEATGMSPSQGGGFTAALDRALVGGHPATILAACDALDREIFRLAAAARDVPTLWHAARWQVNRFTITSHSRGLAIAANEKADTEEQGAHMRANPPPAMPTRIESGHVIGGGIAPREPRSDAAHPPVDGNGTLSPFDAAL